MVQEHLDIKLMLEYHFIAAVFWLTNFIFPFADVCLYGSVTFLLYFSTYFDFFSAKNAFNQAVDPYATTIFANPLL